MKIDWKEVSNSPGYKFIKAKYIRAAYEAGNSKHNSMRDKEELYHKHFKWIISRAKHYAYTQNTTLDRILTEWAFDPKNQYCWLNAYQNIRQPRLDVPTNNYIPMGIKGLKKEHKERYKNWPSNARLQKKPYLKHENVKGRWSKERKDREKRIREYRANNVL